MSEVATATRNPFATERAVESNRNQNAIGDVAVQREIAEVQAAVIMARRFPRDPISAMDRLLQHCTRRTLAEQALYSYSRGGTEITGPSIRLAEAAAQSWGNVQFGIRELEQRNGESTVEALCWDLETNTRETKVFQVPHIRYTRSGTTRLTDPRDIYETIANQGARRLRSCILGIIPGDVIDAAVQQCEETLKASADTSPEALKRVAEAFAEFGVTREQIEQRCQCRLEAIRPAQLVQLRKVYTSLKDGMSAAADWFRSVEGQAASRPDAQERTTGNAALREKLGSRQPDPGEAKAQLARRPVEQSEAASASPSEGERFLTTLQIDLDAAHTFNAIDKLGLREDVAPVTGQLRERVLAAFNAARKRVASENAAAAPIENDPQNAPVDALSALKQEIDAAPIERLRDRASSAEWKAKLRALPSDADRASAERYADGRMQTLRAGA